MLRDEQCMASQPTFTYLQDEFSKVILGRHCSECVCEQGLRPEGYLTQP